MNGGLVMELLKTYSRELFSLAVPIVMALLHWIFAARTKLIWSVHNARVFITESKIKTDEGEQIVSNTIYAASLFVRNSGKATASAVEIVFNWRPPHLNLWPQRDYTVTTNPENRFIIKLPTLGPAEFVGVDILSANHALPEVIQVRSETGTSARIQMTPQKIEPKWKILLATYLVFAGAAVTIYLVIRLMQIMSVFAF